MSYASKFNKSGSKFIFKTSEDCEYVSLADLYNKNSEQIHPLKSLYINKKSKFGDSPCAVIDRLIVVNLPNHLLDIVNDMINDDECVKAINNGEVSFKVYSYIDKTFNKLCYSVEWL